MDRITQEPGKIPRNFLITYTGRVGSSALIDTLKMIPGFLVPVFEELDFWWIEENGQLDSFNDRNIHCALEHVFAAKREGMDLSHASIGLKWRIWGDLDQVARVLRERNVVVFNMMRCDALELISSRYVTDVINKDFNAPQFMLRDAITEEERQRILWKYRMEQHTINLDTYFHLFKTQLQAEKERLSLLRSLHAAGISVYTILYEDFAYKKFRFLNAFVELLGHPSIEAFPTTKLAKVSNPYPSESFRNRAELLTSEQLMPALREWDELVYKSGFRLMNPHGCQQSESSE